MNWPTLIIIISYFYCFLVIIQVFKRIIPQKDGWIFISLTLILITFLLSKIDIILSSSIGGSLCLIFLWIPLWGLTWVNRFVEAQRYGRAWQLFSTLFWLHPSFIWGQYRQLLLALKLANRGQVEIGIKKLQSYYHCNSIMADYSQAFTYEIQGNWLGCLQWLETKVNQKILWQDGTLLSYYLRALGETGKLNQFFQDFPVVKSQLIKLHNVSKINQIQLYAFAFSGQVLAVKDLFKSTLSFYPTILQEFWIVTAKLAIRKQSDALIALSESCVNQHYILKNSIDWRLDNTLPEVHKLLNINSSKIVYSIISTNKNITFTSPRFNLQHRRITLSIIAINFFVFMLEMSLGGSENINTLYELGALVPLVVWEGQFWRLITANFLHYGWLHLFMNMVGLYVIGNFLESLSSRLRYLLIYFSSGIGAMFLFSYLAIYTNNLDYILVGASASIMGLVGSLTAIFLWRWWQEKSLINRNRLIFMLMIVALQFISDFLVPQVSMLSHLFGLIIGFSIELISSLFLRPKIF